MNMAAAVEYTAEQLNYYRICYVVTDILTDGLRTIFKQEWDNRYKTTLGEWKDDPKNGLDFWNGESPRNRKRNARLLTTMKNGDRAEWDFTMLFYAILYSDCIYGLNATVQSHVDDLRNFRNEDFAHMPRGNLSNVDFNSAISKVHTAFHALGLSSSTTKIQDIRNQRSFPTEELNDVLKKVDDLEQELQRKEKELQEKGKELQEKEEERQVLEDQLHTDVTQFCILPPKPTHDIAPRTSEVAKITQQLKAIKGANGDGLSILYISGNPGSGKSQLARLVAKGFSDEVKENPYANSFVMTLNAENSETLLQSFVSFARHCKCPEYAITNTLNAKDLNTEEKIANLKTLINIKTKLYKSWLLVVDNVTSVSRVHVHLPDPGNEEWVRGQLLITTQDTASIPLTSSSIQHISVSEGMHPDDASSLLRLLSGVTDSEMEKQIAKALDYQPLALASAATYVSQVRQKKAASKFGWGDYLTKLQKGQRSGTETILAETNPSYQKSMTTAITLAVEKAMTSAKVIHHMFNCLSVCSPQPIHEDIVINYIMGSIDEEFQDEDMISTRMNRCSLLLFEEEESGVYIRVHGVVYDVINTVTADYAKVEQLKVVLKAVTSFSQFIEEDISKKGNYPDPLAINKNIVPHLKTLIIKIEHLLSIKEICSVAKSSVLTMRDYAREFQSLGRMCNTHCEFYSALKYFNTTLQYINQSKILDSETIYIDLGIVHGSLGDKEQAKNYYSLALDILLKKLGPDHVDVSTTYNNLGNVHRALGDIEQAKDYYSRALNIYLKNLGPGHVYVARTYNNLGIVHVVLGDKEQAKNYYSRALDIYLEKLGPDHVDVARTYNNLGIVLCALGDNELTKDYYLRALHIYLRTLGPDHVDVARTYNNLGIVHSELGDKEQAKNYYSRALDIYLEKLGADHVDVAKTYYNLGIVHSELGDKEQAKDYYSRALEIYLKTLGPDHVDVGRTYNNLGNVHSKLGDKQQAKTYYSRALDFYLEKLGPDHVDVARTYNNLGIVHNELGEKEQAKDYYSRALNIYLKTLGPDHVDVARIYNNLGIVHSELGDKEQAKNYYSLALDIYLEKLGPDHVDVATTYYNLGIVHSELGDEASERLF